MEIIYWMFGIILVYFVVAFNTKNIKTTPASQLKELNLMKLTKLEFRQLLDEYKINVKRLKNTPEEAENYVNDFLEKTALCRMLIFFMGSLEWDYVWDKNKSRIWGIKSIPKEMISGDKQEKFIFKKGKIKITYFPENIHTGEDWTRDFEVSYENMIVMRFEAEQEMSEVGIYWECADYSDMQIFKPAMWIFDFVEIYKNWQIDVKKYAEKEEKEKKVAEIKDIENKYL
jgi:hypothetical protein